LRYISLIAACVLATGSLLFAANNPSGDWANQLKKKIKEKQVPTWMREQIEQDLAPFQDGISRQSLDQAEQYSSGIGRFKIIKGKLSYTINDETTLPLGLGICKFGHQKRYCTGKAKIIARAIQRILDCSKLPDLDLVFVLTDGNWGNTNPPGPLFSFSKNQKSDQKVILIPDPHMLGQHAYFTQQVIEGIKKYPWDKKEQKAFWRGQTTGGQFSSLDRYHESPRFKIVDWTRTHPDLVNAKFNGFAMSSPEIKELLIEQGHQGDTVPISEHLLYAYQIQVDGNTAAWSRMYWQLLSNSLMLKQDSDNIQWYYQALSPYRHYVPFNNDASDLIEKIEWARENPEQAQTIIRNATQFAQQNLAYEDLLYYIYLLLHAYAKLQDFKPAL
jgi:hypothetical protein